MNKNSHFSFSKSISWGSVAGAFAWGRVMRCKRNVMLRACAAGWLSPPPFAAAWRAAASKRRCRRRALGGAEVGASAFALSGALPKESRFGKRKVCTVWAMDQYRDVILGLGKGGAGGRRKPDRWFGGALAYAAHAALGAKAGGARHL